MQDNTEDKMPDILAGNFQVKNPVKVEAAAEGADGDENVTEQLKQRALASLGGSMVYVERDMLSWDGESSK